jgi:hypothetical protein
MFSFFLVESLVEVKDDNDKTDSNEKQSKPSASGKKDKKKVGGGNPDGVACKKTKTAKDSASLDVNNGIPKSKEGDKHNPTPMKVLLILLLILFSMT